MTASHRAPYDSGHEEEEVASLVSAQPRGCVGKSLKLCTLEGPVENQQLVQFVVPPPSLPQ